MSHFHCKCDRSLAYFIFLFLPLLPLILYLFWLELCLLKFIVIFFWFKNFCSFCRALLCELCYINKWISKQCGRYTDPQHSSTARHFNFIYVFYLFCFSAHLQKKCGFDVSLWRATSGDNYLSLISCGQIKSCKELSGRKLILKLIVICKTAHSSFPVWLTAMQ